MNRRIVFLLSLLLLSLCCEAVAARVWTDNNGRSVNATFVRIFGEEVVLREPSGNVFKVPIRTLSEEDQAYLRSKLESQGFRVFTSVDGKQIEAQYLRIRDGKVFMKINDAPTSIPFDRFSLADQQYIREQAAAEGEQQEVPATTRELGPSRIWKDEDDNTIRARYDSILPDGRILLAVDDDTMVIDVKKLSQADHEHLRTVLEPQGLANLIPEKPVPTSEPEPAPKPDRKELRKPETVANSDNHSSTKTKPLPEPQPPSKPPTVAKVDRPSVAPPPTQRRPVENSRAENAAKDQLSSARTRSRARTRQSNDLNDPFTFVWLQIMLTIGGLIGTVGHFWVAACAFSRGDHGWGLAALFCCPFDLVYGFIIKDENYGPLALMLMGMVINAVSMTIGVIVAVSSVAA